MEQENKNIIGDIVSIKKVGEKVIITKETIVSELNYADPNSKDLQKPDHIKTGVENSTPVQEFDNKATALEHYGVQLKNCKYGLEVVEKGMKDLEEEIMDSKIFEQINKIKDKMDTSKYKGKFKMLDLYLERHSHYKQGQTQIKIRSKHIPYFETILKHITEL